jgi:hypothetical protein
MASVIMNSFFRPSLSVRRPKTSAPATSPTESRTPQADYESQWKRVQGSRSIRAGTRLLLDPQGRAIYYPEDAGM